MMRVFLLSVALLLTINVFAQKVHIRPDTVINGVKFSYVEEMPSHRWSLPKYLKKSFRYPESALNNNIEGRVIVKFSINEDGSISDVHVIQSLSPDCDSEAVRLYRNMPRWRPGMQNGKRVKVIFTQPLTFTLDKDKHR